MRNNIASLRRKTQKDHIDVLFTLYYISLHKLLRDKINVFVYGAYSRIPRARILRNNGHVILGLIFLKSRNNRYESQINIETLAFIYSFHGYRSCNHTMHTRFDHMESNEGRHTYKNNLDYNFAGRKIIQMSTLTVWNFFFSSLGK